MIPEQLCIFDIETVRQFRTFEDCKREAPQTSEAWEYTCRSKFPGEDPAEVYEDKAGLFPEFGRVVCIVAYFNANQTFFKESLADQSESELLQAFFEWLSANKIRVVAGHKIKTFDVPFVNTRAAANGLPLFPLFRTYGRKPWELNQFVDTWELWKQGVFASTQAGNLASVCAALGIASPKEDISGADVGRVFYEEGTAGVERILEYCANDVKANYRALVLMQSLGFA